MRQKLPQAGRGYGNRLLPELGLWRGLNPNEPLCQPPKLYLDGEQCGNFSARRSPATKMHFF